MKCHAWIAMGVVLGGCHAVPKAPPSTEAIGSRVAGDEPAFRSGLAPDMTPAAAYFCPMHPQITSDQPGRCPICGMPLYHR